MKESLVVGKFEADRIAAFLDAHAETDRADLAFVFGTLLPDPAYVAADLYRRGVVPLIVLTGGANRYTGGVEAQAHLAILTSLGIPREHIIVESESTNTRENVVFALPKIAAVTDVSRLRSVVAVVKWYHARRALMTLKRYFPSGVRYFTRCYEPEGITRSQWYLDDESTAPVLKEREAIPRYLEWGDIAEVTRERGAFV